MSAIQHYALDCGQGQGNVALTVRNFSIVKVCLLTYVMGAWIMKSY